MIDGNLYQMDADELRYWLAEKYTHDFVSTPQWKRILRAVRRLSQLTGLTRLEVTAQAIVDGRNLRSVLPS